MAPGMCLFMYLFAYLYSVDYAFLNILFTTTYRFLRFQQL